MDMVVLVYNPGVQRYEPRRVQIKTLNDAVALRGSAAVLLGEAKFAWESGDQALKKAQPDPDELRRAITEAPGEPVTASFLERDGALVPADFHSLNLATLYYNFERAADFFSRIGGLEQAEMGTPQAYYFPEMDISGIGSADNAFFMPLLGFLFLPFDALQKVPLAINGGVLGHEYSHAVFNLKVHDKETFPEADLEWNSPEPEATPGLNLLASIDEGIADLFGTGVTCSEDFSVCDPAFLALSLPSRMGTERQLDLPHCMTPPLLEHLAELNYTDFSNAALEYEVGSVLASAMWRATSDGDLLQSISAEPAAAFARSLMFQTLYKALGSSTSSIGLRALVASHLADQANFRLDSSQSKGVLDTIVDAADDPILKAALCRSFLDRFGFTLDQLKSCPGSSTAYGECSH
jgi:hypothetical protein